MPKQSDDMSRLELVLPAGVLAGLRAAAEAAGESLNVYVVRAAARRARIGYAPRPRGAPKKT